MINVEVMYRVQREHVLQGDKVRLIDLSTMHWLFFEKFNRFFAIRQVTSSIGERKKATSDRLWLAANLMNGKPEDFNKEFLYMVAACTLSCQFCYILPETFFKSYEGKLFTTEEILCQFEEARKKEEIKCLRVTGGEPFIIPEHLLSVLEGLHKRRLDDVVVSSETNLTTGRQIQRLMKEGVIPNDLFAEISNYKNFILFPCFKGSDPENFCRNTGADQKYFDEQFDSLKMYIEAGIRLYPYIIHPNPFTFSRFLSVLEERFGEKMLLLLHILEPRIYGNPQVSRGTFNILYGFPHTKWEEIEKNYHKCVEALDGVLRKRFGVGYKEIEREKLSQ